MAIFADVYFMIFNTCSTYSNLSNQLSQEVHSPSPFFDDEVLDIVDANSLSSPPPTEDSTSTSILSDLAPESSFQQASSAEGMYGLCKVCMQDPV